MDFSASSDIGAIPGPLDLALVCLPTAEIVDALEDLARIPTRAAIIFSAGFRGTTGPLAGKTEMMVKKLAKQYGIAILGAKSAGLFRAGSKLDATRTLTKPKAGNIGFFSQSGSLAAAILDWASTQDIGFSTFANLGNKSGLDEADLLSHMADDPDTSVILGCIENIESGTRFMLSAHGATRKKPVILLRSGVTGAGSCAMAAHNGERAGDNLVYAAAMRQTGIMTVDTLEDLFHKARAFTGQPLPKGPNTAILANGGGLGILAADACERAGLNVARLSHQTMESLETYLPPFSSRLNPVDVLPDADAERVMKTASILLEDPNVHSLFLVLSPVAPDMLRDCAKALAEKSAGLDKPVFACLMGGNGAEEARGMLAKSLIPCYAFPGHTAEAMAAALTFASWKERPLPVEISYRHDLSRSRKIVREARDLGFSELSGSQAQALLTAFEMPLPPSALARTSDEAANATRHTGYPVRLLLDAPGLPPENKEAFASGSLTSEQSVRDEFLRLTNKASRLWPELPIRGCLVQALPSGFKHSVAVSFRRDPAFGPLLFISRKRDTDCADAAFPNPSTASICRIAPLSLDDARDLARSVLTPEPRQIGNIATLDEAAANVNENAFAELEDILLIMSELAVDMPEIIEATCGPVFFSEEKALVTDAHFYLNHVHSRAVDGSGD